MSYWALATDYDGTLATEGQVQETTLAALKRWQETGRKLILVTGRQVDDLYTAFPQASWFDCIVAENGALLSFPATGEQQLVGSAPPESLILALQRRQVEPLSVGQGIVATWTPHETTVAEVLEELGLAWQVIFNKGAVMLLPEGIDKASGLKAALNQMDLSPQRVIGVGDAENDLPFLQLCGLSVSVANALPDLKARTDWVMVKSRGDGVVELIERLL
jgi:hydroxymethylpyrimidine pyrophosphatase-like HAD family hydrolase